MVVRYAAQRAHGLLGAAVRVIRDALRQFIEDRQSGFAVSMVK